MDKIAKELGLYLEAPYCLYAETIYVATDKMTEAEYRAMEKEIDEFCIRGSGFKVYAWNDDSGYEYWAREGESNYIQVTVRITDPTRLVKEALTEALDKGFQLFRKYDMHN